MAQDCAHVSNVSHCGRTRARSSYFRVHTGESSSPGRSNVKHYRKQRKGFKRTSAYHKTSRRHQQSRRDGETRRCASCWGARDEETHRGVRLSFRRSCSYCRYEPSSQFSVRSEYCIRGQSSRRTYTYRGYDDLNGRGGCSSCESEEPKQRAA